MFVWGKSKTIFFTSNTLIYGISRDGSKNVNIRTCEHVILGQLRIWAHTTTYAALDNPIVRKTRLTLISNSAYYKLIHIFDSNSQPKKCLGKIMIFFFNNSKNTEMIEWECKGCSFILVASISVDNPPSLGSHPHSQWTVTSISLKMHWNCFGITWNHISNGNEEWAPRIILTRSLHEYKHKYKSKYMQNYKYRYRHEYKLKYMHNTKTQLWRSPLKLIAHISQHRQHCNCWVGITFF